MAAEMDQRMFPGPWRELTQYERAIVDRLLSVDFRGRDEVRRQLAQCTVRQICGDGTIEILGDKTSRVTVVNRIPVEATVEDADHNLIHYLLHVVDGYVAELEVYTDTLLPIHRLPSPDDLVVIRGTESTPVSEPPRPPTAPDELFVFPGTWPQ